MSLFVYDSGALIAAENGCQAMRRIHLVATALGDRPMVPGPVLTQAWRGGPQSARMARLLSGCQVVTGYSEEGYRRAGRLLAEVELPGRKRPDAVDALVAMTVAIHQAEAVVTSDPSDLAAYLSTLGLDTEIIAV